MFLQGCLLLVSHCGYLSPKSGRKKRKQTSLRHLGHFAQTTHLHTWQQIAARIEADHDYSHISWSYLVKEPHWLNPEGQGWWKTCWRSTWRNKIVIWGTLLYLAKCTMMHRTEWYYSIAHKRNRDDVFQKHQHKHLVPPVFSDQSRPGPGSLTHELTH